MVQPPTPRTDGINQESARSQSTTQAPTAIPPFAWQHDRQLLILDNTDEGWVFAELRFDPTTCLYSEIRRATYDWPREAAGVLLARTITVGPQSRNHLEVGLTNWIHHVNGKQSSTA